MKPNQHTYLMFHGELDTETQCVILVIKQMMVTVD